MQEKRTSVEGFIYSSDIWG